MDNWNWDTNEAWRWLNNCEYAYNASRRAALHSDGESYMQSIFEEVYTLGNVDCALVDWGAITEIFIDELVG